MKRRLLVIAFLVLIAHSCSPAHILRVPSDYAKIQLAVNASVNGDTVVVFPGTYAENVIFRGKKIVLTSRFYETGDVGFISSTIINGGSPVNHDTASCVLFINGEDSTAVLQGFTLTGGKGTAWKDEHSSGTYREGGGVLAALSSPTIRNNFIVNNDAIDATGLAGAGGGGLRCGDGSPRILNNVIMSNRGMYGGGIVLNFCDGALIRNNILYLNRVEQFTPGGATYGGGGIWMNDRLSAGAKSHTIENNTIYLNFSLDPAGQPSGSGAAILVWNNASATVRNNIMWENHFTSSLGPVAVLSASATFSYNDIMTTVAGTGNIDVDPAMADSSFYLKTTSPCVDAGDPSAIYNDVENSGSPGTALFPSRGTLRNDLGAYGGKGASLFPNFNRPSFFTPLAQIGFGYVPPTGVPRTMTLYYWNYGTKVLRVDSIRIRGNILTAVSVTPSGPRQINTFSYDSIKVSWAPTQAGTMADTLLVYSNDSAQTNPARIIVTGKSFAIVPAQAGVMYAFSGSADGGRLYTVDTSNGSLTLRGSTNYIDVLSARINPVTKEITALALGTSTDLIRVSSDAGLNAAMSSLTLTNPKGMAFKSDGTLYIGVFTGEIYSVSTSTGAATLVASTGLKIAGLAFNPVNGALFATVRPPLGVKDYVYTIDLGTGIATLLGPTGFGVTTKDITFDSKGRLFGVIDSGSSRQCYLISINTGTGNGKLIGAMGVAGMETIELVSYYVTSVRSLSSILPTAFGLEQNYPNPFNPSTAVSYQLSALSYVTVRVYDVVGREVATLVSEDKPPGSYTIQWDASKLSSGVYFYTFKAGNFVQTKKMILVK